MTARVRQFLLHAPALLGGALALALTGAPFGSPLVAQTPAATATSATAKPAAPQRTPEEERLHTDWANLGRFREANAALPPARPGEARVVFLGNSITEGWAPYFAAQFPGKPYVNRGIGGQTTPQLLLRFRQDVIALHPRVVVILAGTNDIAGNTGPSTLGMIEDNLASMAELARANGIRVVLSSVLPVYDYPWRPGLTPAPKIIALNAWMRDYAAAHGDVYLDYHTPMADARQGLPKELSGDGVHPNAAGYRVMAPLAERAITEALEHVVFFDDFTGPTLDRTRWTVRVTDATNRTANNEQQAYVDDASSADPTLRIVHGTEAAGAASALRIQAHARPGFVTPDGKHFDFVSGRLDTRGKVEFTYGTAAARMKLSAGAGLWPAFWILGTGPWPATGEIDIMENVGDSTWVSAALHGPGYSGNTPLVQRTTFPPGQDVTGWHVYAVDWSPDTLTFRVDDRAFYTVPRAAVERYGRWAFDNPKYLILNLALGGGYPRAVNGVSGPHPGLPDASVQRIQAGEATVLVDWVRVTRR